MNTEFLQNSAVENEVVAGCVFDTIGIMMVVLVDITKTAIQQSCHPA